MSGFGRAGTRALLGDTWRIPAEWEQPTREPALRRISTWLLGPAVLSAVWWTVTSSHLPEPAFRAAFLAYSIVAPALIGLLWWHRRPGSQIGPLLTAFGFAAWPLCLQGSEMPVLFSIGVVAEAPYAFVTLLVCLALPFGRLNSVFESRVMAAWAAVLVLGWVPYLAMLPSLQGGGPLSACVPACPENAFAVAAPTVDVLTLVGQLGTIATVCLATLLLGSHVVRFAGSSSTWRRANWPVVASVSVFLVAFTGYHLSRGLALLPPAATSLVATIYLAACVLLPLGFLVALVRAELFSTQALLRLTASLGFVVSASELRESLALALGDRSLRLGIWDAAARALVQPDGADMPQRGDERARTWIPVVRNGATVAAFTVDDALSPESRLLASAADVAFLAISDVQVAQDTRALRATASTSTDDERQRIARDMHDSAQQRLVALRVQVGLASEKLDGQPDEQQMLSRLGHELDYAIEDVRNLARRLLTPFVVRNGVGTALRAVTRSGSMPVRVDDRGLSRHDPETEQAVYNVCLEALQNAADHGGDGVSAQVRIKDAADGIWFSVTDDGVGFDPHTTRPGHGLMGMSDRALLAGGTINVHAPAGHGVRISGRIPDSRATDQT